MLYADIKPRTTLGAVLLLSAMLTVMGRTSLNVIVSAHSGAAITSPLLMALLYALTAFTLIAEVMLATAIVCWLMRYTGTHRRPQIRQHPLYTPEIEVQT